MSANTPTVLYNLNICIHVLTSWHENMNVLWIKFSDLVLFLFFYSVNLIQINLLIL